MTRTPHFGSIGAATVRERLPLLRSLTLAALMILAAPAAAQERLAVKGGKVIPVAGPPIEGGVVLIRNGKIEAVGKNVPIPADAKVIDATGKVVVPGFVEAHSSRGMDQPNESNPNVPFLSVLDALDPSAEWFDECRRNGVTTALVIPGNATMLGGQGAIVKTAGGYVDEMIAKRSAGIKISLKPTADRNRMGHLALLRKELDDARDALKTSEAKVEAKPEVKAADGGIGEGGAAAEDRQPPPRQRPGQRPGQGGPAGRNDPTDATLVREALGKLLKGESLAVVYCELAMDVPQAIKLINDYKLKGVLVLGQDCYKAAKEIAKSKLPVVLDPTLVFWETDPRTGEEKQIVLPKVYREAGVSVTFQSTGIAAGNLFRAPPLPPTVGTNYLWYQAATAVKYGTPADEALAAVTRDAAKVIGADKFAGTLEPGKDGDLVILTGDPLKLGTWVETTVVNGKVVYERENDRKIKQLMK
ncbi:MAG: amidohydrolase family protein [Gemmataceae bacterium]